MTAGYIDTEANKAFAATRTANPAVLIDYDITSGARVTVPLPKGTGSWDMAKSGDMLAVGTTAGAKANTTHVSIYNTKTKKFTKSIPLPGSRIVMSVVEDTFEAEDGNGRYFWVGTYHPNGGKLFRIDIGAGTNPKPIARDRTPKNSSGNSLWSKSAYVRSLSADASGVTVGLGTEVTDVWRISQKGKAPKRWNTEITSEVQDASFAYSLASHAPQADEEPAHTLIGTEQPAKLIDIDSEAGTLKRTISLDSRHTVDRIAVDSETATAWFTTRPTGALYSLNLSDGGNEIVEHSPPHFGSETRGLAAADGKVHGITGTGELWTFDPASDDPPEKVELINSGSETVDTVPQGVAQFGGRTLVAGHWRYQVHGDPSVSRINFPGEPKAQVVVGDKLYAAAYPSASIHEIGTDLSQGAKKIAEIGHGQVRPAAIEHNRDENKLIVATGASYGTYGGALSLIDPNDLSATPDVYTNPLQYGASTTKRHQISAIEPRDDGYFIGTWTKGEALDPIAGQRATIRYWKPDANGNGTTGTLHGQWKLPFHAQKITDIESVSDRHGDIVIVAARETNHSWGYLVAIDPDQGGKVLWHMRVAGPVVSMEQSDDYLIAQINGQLLQLGITRSGVAASPVRGVSSNFRSTFAALSEDAVATKTVGYVSSGAGGAVGTANQGQPRVAYRVAGDERYRTAVAVSEQTFDSANTVVLARGDDFADALSAGPLAAALNAPILLTQGGTLTKETKAEINRLKATKAVLVGGTGVIPDTVKAALPNRVRDTQRLSGINRYETSVSVASELQKQLGGGKIDVLAATGLNYADAVSAGPAAITSKSAIVLYDHNSSAKDARAFLKDQAKSVAGLGGPVVTSLRQAGITVPKNSQLVGADRFATATLIAEKYFGKTSSAYVASGLNFPDGLTAGVAAGLEEAPLLLARPTELTSPTVKSIRSGRGSEKVYLVGGSGVLHLRLQNEIRDIR